MRSIALCSTSLISVKDMTPVMNLLQARRDERDGHEWVLERNGQRVTIVLAPEELEILPESILREIVDELGDIPETMVVVIFNDNMEDGRFTWRMAKAVGIAMAELWPIVWHDYASPAERLYAPGQRPVQSRIR